MEVYALAIAPGGEMAVLEGGRTVRLLDSDLREVRCWPSPFPVESPQTWAAIELTFSADGRRLALGVRSGGRVGVVTWEVQGGETLAQTSWAAPDLPGVPDCGTRWALRLGFAADGARAAVLHKEEGETDCPPCSLTVHDGRTGAQLATIDHGQDPLNDWQFSPDGRTLAVGRDNTVEIWDLTMS
jgi:WD40 repeat protein